MAESTAKEESGGRRSSPPSFSVGENRTRHLMICPWSQILQNGVFGKNAHTGQIMEPRFGRPPPCQRNIKRTVAKPKNVLRLPELDHSKASVLQSLGSVASKRTYAFAINDFIAWYCSEPRLAFGRTVVLRYRYELEARRLAPATMDSCLRIRPDLPLASSVELLPDPCHRPSKVLCRTRDIDEEPQVRRARTRQQANDDFCWIRGASCGISIASSTREISR